MYCKFTRIDSFVEGLHMTDPPASLIYSRVVYRYILRIAFTLAALNNLDI